LEVYHCGSGQLVNRDKSTMFFSKNCTQDMKQVVSLPWPQYPQGGLS
jgi:hypothetical protein